VDTVTASGVHYGPRNEKDGEGSMLKGKKVIALGERDGIQGGAIAACARAAGAEVVLEKTYCFV
jgi:glycine reductase